MVGRWILAFLVLSSFAGCADGSASDPGPNLEAKVDHDSGAISGVVVDQAVRAVEDVRVVVLGQEGVNTTTDSQGRFVLEDLDVGFYNLEFRKPAYATVTASADVAAADVVALKVMMERISEMDPYHTILKFDAFADASVGLVNWAVDVVLNPYGLGTCECYFPFETDGHFEALVLEAFWDDSIPPPDPYGETEYYYEVYTADYDEYVSGYDTHPMHVMIDEAAFPQEEHSYLLWVYPDDVWPAAQQEYEVFLTAFYVEAPSDDWSVGA